MSKLSQKLQDTIEWLKGFFFGMAVYDAYRHFQRERADLEHLFVLISFGDLLGIPILPPYYNMRLLPYIVPLLNRWRWRMLREKDLTDLVDLGG
ncbi:MAG: hypothetical protein D6755_08785 [Anaerolineae bacterium]|nr:MAG: hypothetical protein D6755_08785 [Anaerolineae bacterium]